MSKEAICEVKSDPTREDLKYIQTVLQSSEENVNHNVSSSPRHSGRQVTINEDVAEETSFMDKSKDYQHNNEKNKTPINNSHSSSTDDIMSIHDITDDENIVKEDTSRPKCLQCISEVFECTIWFFKSMTSSIRSGLQNCCSCNRKTVDIKNREFDDDGEYWNGNVMTGDGEEGVISFSFDKKEDSNESKETFKQTDLNGAKDHSKDNKGFEDIDIKTNHTASEHKPVNETRCSSGNEIGHRNSTTSAVCYVNVHHESHENKDVSNVASGGVSSSGNNVAHDGGHRGSQSGGNHGGHSGNHDGGHDESYDGGHSSSHDDGNGGNDCGETGGGSDD